MNITNAKYIKNTTNDENENVQCVINGQHWCVPMVASNRHYAEILRLVEAGTLTIADAD